MLKPVADRVALVEEDGVLVFAGEIAVADLDLLGGAVFGGKGEPEPGRSGSVRCRPRTPTQWVRHFFYWVTV
ncbi:MAG TPA: hypothetical protein VGG03_13350, partial [Thermoanaerobaculia bacterium]